VQGGDGGQNRILVDQVSVSDAYHFGGVVSVLNTDVIDRLEFMSGGYTAEYGDALSGGAQGQAARRQPRRRARHGGDLAADRERHARRPIGGDGKGSWLVAAGGRTSTRC
jgi:hypothetical protein